MTPYQKLFKDALNENQGRLRNLYAFKPIIECANKLVEEAEKNSAFSFITRAYPTHLTDYLLISLYLAEKGSISKDAEIFIDELQNQLNLKQTDSITNGTDEILTVSFICPDISYYVDGFRHPKIVVNIDASKSKICHRVPTGEMVPVYELICDDA